MSPEPGGVAAHTGASRGPGLARLSAGRKEGGAGAGEYRYSYRYYLVYINT